MEPPFLGSHPATDFLNTRPTPEGVSIELIGDGASFVTWLKESVLIDASMAATIRRQIGPRTLDAAAAGARELREWAREWIARWRDAPGGNYRAEVRRLNDVLARATCSRQLVIGTDGFEVTERCRLDSGDALIALVAAQIALLVATEEPALVKRCAGPGCSLWFVDRTKAHRRMFCSATACGNRAKVAAYRERQRSGVDQVT